jgi:hypothetical protein
MWIECSDQMPDENQVVFWRDEDETWLGDYCDPSADEPCLVATRTYRAPCISPGGLWEVDGAEWEGDQPTHWHPLPEPFESKEKTNG